MEELQLNVSQLLKEHVGSTRVVSLEGPFLELEDAPPADVQANLTLTRTDRGVWVSGPARFSMDAFCSRCLVPFSSWIKVKVDDVYLPTVEVLTGARLRYEAIEDVESFKIDDHHILDLTEAFRQYRIAATPMAPLCRAECLGICSHCGTDLNEGTCECEPQIDPRWAKLRELLT